MDKNQKNTRAVWIKAALFGGNWNNGVNSGSRASNWNNHPANSNTNIGAVLLCDESIFALSTPRLGRQTILFLVSRFCPASANTLRGSA
jgi:hypothetical protein